MIPGKPWPREGNPFEAGKSYLIHDPQDGDWALWYVSNVAVAVVVGWTGKLSEVTFPWGGAAAESSTLAGAAMVYEVTQEQADAYVMAARHLPSAGAWYRFANRQVT